MKKTVKKIWNILTLILTLAVIGLTVLIWGVKLLGFEVFVVQSGSMEPTYHVGSLVYVKQTPPQELQVGDTITYKLNASTRATHRIVEVVEENGSIAFRTKGDANEEADNGLVDPSAIVGRVVFTVPRLGFLAAYIQQPPGLYIAIAAAAVIVLLTLLPDLIFDDKSKSNKQEETK